MESANHRIAYFVSPHGYGHAARASAVMAAIHELDPALRFEIFTQVPGWFFEDSATGAFGYHALLTDIGLVQRTPLVEDLPATLKRLEGFLPFDARQIRDVARQIDRLGCQLIVCDIAPMGIAVSFELGIPSVLIENFTWDWIYEEYAKYDSRMWPHVTYLRGLFDAADYHVQTEPVCRPGNADLVTMPVSRKIRTPCQQIRRRLGIPSQAKVAMVTMGGIPWHYTFLEKLVSQNGLYFIIPGADKQMQPGTSSPTGAGGLVLLPHRSNFFHPDLVNATDVVIGKAGYSTLAEVYYAGVPYGYIARPNFRESQVLAAYIQEEMSGLPINETDFGSGEWISSLRKLLTLPRIPRQDANGADQVARFVLELVNGLN